MTPSARICLTPSSISFPQRAGVKHPRLVVDLGSGTGLSTRPWGPVAGEVVGIEPNPNMIEQARRNPTTPANVRYQEGFSHDTRLPDACADLVTASTALHWMEPVSTFAEVGRILRPGGVFAASDVMFPPFVHWEAEAAWDETIRRAVKLREERADLDRQLLRWKKDEHPQRMRESGQFRHVTEVYVHQVEMGNAERYIGLRTSEGSITSLLEAGITEAEIALDTLKEVAHRVIGETPIPWIFWYRVRVGVK